MTYESIALTRELFIDRVISIHYFEYTSDFSFSGESHDFWEFLCVDKGTVNVLAGETPHTLFKGDIIFHKPGEFHNVNANGVIAPNLVVIGFECVSPAMDFFRDKILHIGPSEQKLLGAIIREASLAFSNRLDDPYCEKLIRRENSPFACEQLIQMYLQQLLIQLFRTYHTTVPSGIKPHDGFVLPSTGALPSSDGPQSEAFLFSQLTAYLEDHIDCPLTIERICHDNLIGRSRLQKLFRNQAGCGVIDYFNDRKTDAARQMLRDGKQNISQISDALGYTSVHYFSRQFKKRTGMTPSEYASSIRRLCEPPAH